MTLSTGFVSFMPSANIGVVSPIMANNGVDSAPQPNIHFGDTVLKVLDLVTGADMTSHFDTACQGFSAIANAGLYQIDTTPNTSHCHLALIQRADQVSTYKMVAGNVHARPGTGTITTPGASVGDIILQTVYPTIANTIPGDFNGMGASIFEPTIQTTDTVNQLVEVGFGGSLVSPALFFLQAANTPYSGEIVLDIMYGSVPSYFPNMVGGSELLHVLDLTAGIDYTSHYGQHIGEGTATGNVPFGGLPKALYNGNANTNNLTLFVTSPPKN